MITETVLEMHYHRPLMDLFRSTFGLGSTGDINFYKYSPQRECFVGFDQAYVKSQLSQEEFFKMLRDSAATSGYRLKDKFIGYFLQFKVVKELHVRRKYTPTGIVGKPHYRVKLDTTKNINTGLSQHELLHNLSQNAGAMVYYACPMLFDRSAIYDIDVDLDALRLADLTFCPSAYLDNDNHHIYYNDPSAVPVWCSEPVTGKAIFPLELSVLLSATIGQLEAAHSAANLLKLLTGIEAVGLNPSSEGMKGMTVPSILPLVGESLTIIRVGPGAEEAKNREV